MRLRFLAAALTAFIALPALAEAASGVATANVNMRSGPSTAYPAVVVIPVGSRLEIHGCLASEAWCDVSFARGRGWVSGRYIQATYRSDRIYVDRNYYQRLGIPTIVFDLDTYWGRHYRQRDFYRERNEWRRGPDRRPPPSWGNNRPEPGWDRPRPPRPDSGWNDGRPPRQDWDNQRPPRRDDDRRPPQGWDNQRPDRDTWNTGRPQRPDWDNQRPPRDDDRRPPQGWGNERPRGDDNRPGRDDARPDRRPDRGQDMQRPDMGRPDMGRPDRQRPDQSGEERNRPPRDQMQPRPDRGGPDRGGNDCQPGQACGTPN